MMLKGQVALVTGGGRGLGRAFAVALAKAGAAVAVTARTQGEIDETCRRIADAGGAAIAISADVTERQAVARVVAEVEKSLGTITLLVNSAGVFSAVASFAEIDPDEWWLEVEINLRGPALCTRGVLPGMIARGQGRIINLASGAGLRALETCSAYCVGKAALIRLTESVASETATHGITVFAVDPGTVRTPLSEHAIQSELMGRRAPEVQAWFRSLDANDQFTPIEQSVQLVLDLASGKADALSGCFIGVDDDLDDLVGRAGAIQSEEHLKLRLS